MRSVLSRCLGVLAGTALALTATTALAPPASAAGMCDDEPFPDDVWVAASGGVFLGADPDPEGLPYGVVTHVCVLAQTVGIGVHDGTSRPGYVVRVLTSGPLGSQPVLEVTGVEVGVPYVGSSTDPSYPIAETGTDVCAWVDGQEQFAGGCYPVWLAAWLNPNSLPVGIEFNESPGACLVDSAAGCVVRPFRVYVGGSVGTVAAGTRDTLVSQPVGTPRTCVIGLAYSC